MTKTETLKPLSAVECIDNMIKAQEFHLDGVRDSREMTMKALLGADESIATYEATIANLRVARERLTETP